MWVKFVVQQFEIMFYRCCQLYDVLTEGERDSKWDARIQIFEEKTSAIALWLDENLWKIEVQGSLPVGD